MANFLGYNKCKFLGLHKWKYTRPKTHDNLRTCLRCGKEQIADNPVDNKGLKWRTIYTPKFYH